MRARRFSQNSGRVIWRCPRDDRGEEGSQQMFARTSTWSGSPEELRKWAEHAARTVKGFVEGLPGNAGAVFLIDRDSGTALTLTLWDSQEAARATDRFADQSRASTVAATGTALVAHGSYEVVARS
jgi:heme-degrading monooxygenase HmoA